MAVVLVVAAVVAVSLVAGGWQRGAAFRHEAGEGQRTHCPGCAVRLAGDGPRPVLLPLTGRCPACAVRIGPPALTVEVVTAAILGFLVMSTSSAGELAAFGWVAVLAVPLALVDVAVLRLPDRLTLLAYLGTLALLAVAAVVERRHDDLIRALLGGLALAAFYLVLFSVNPAGVGLGDVKLAAALGTALGWLGWTSVLTGTFVAYLAAALYGVALIATRRGGRKSEIPFGPFMIMGTLGVLLAGG
ncbi:prepilin peptidase [Streptosporangium sp. KLBMP 9127]|nr:A24 family peptidase [Streptosporangium sp. KLBMP 9127]